MTSIYGLIDPREPNHVRYVGKTVKKLSVRLKHHLKDYSTIRKARWIQSVIREGFTPEIILLETVPDDGWEEAERLWIHELRRDGHNLTNATDGGEGTLGWEPSEETRKKMSDKAKGRRTWNTGISSPGHPHTEEFKKAVGDRFRGRTWTPEQREKLRQSTLGRVPWNKGLKGKRKEAS